MNLSKDIWRCRGVRITWFCMRVLAANMSERLGHPCFSINMTSRYMSLALSLWEC